MRSKPLVTLALLLLAAAGCSSGNRPANPIDRVLAPRFAKEGIHPEQASTAELCRRLGADLLGRYPTADEVHDDCAGRSAEAAAQRFQSTHEYRLASQRAWRDRLETTDVLIDWRILKELYAKVDELSRGKLGYREFAVITMGHPGFVLSHEGPLNAARGAFRAFAGREATEAEAADFAALYRPWIPTGDLDPDFPYVEYRPGAAIEPFLCTPASMCEATLYGGASIDLTDLAGEEEVAWEDLSSSQRARLQEPGRLLTAQPFFWEAEADAILDRLLGWSDGGRTPREPGIVLPEVRELLADFLRETGDVPAAERMVIGTWLYRMKAEVADDGFGDDPAAPVPAIYAHGPVKPASPEVWLASAAAVFGDLSTCDPRYPDLYGYFLILDAVDMGMVDAQTAAADTQRLYEMQQYDGAFDAENGIPGLPFIEFAQVLGGCPGLESPRREATGLAYAFSQEALAEEMCSELEGEEATVTEALQSNMPLLWGRSPRAEEIADYEAAAAACDGAECEPAGLRRGVCVGLLGGTEMNFY